MSAVEGVRVLDLSEGIAPGVVGMFLSDFGADVVIAEPPNGSALRRNPGFATWARGKRSVVVDPSSDKDRQWLIDSLAGADVCILGTGESLDQWGEDVAKAAEANKRLITLEMPAYLPEGTPWYGGHESNSLLSAAGAVSWRQSSDDGNPVEPVHNYLVSIQGLWAAVCTVAALVERERSGFGQTITVTGLNGVQEATVYALSMDPNAPDPSTAIGNVGRHPTYRPVKARDAWMASGALGPKFENWLLEILGITDMLKDPRLNGMTQMMVMPENVDWAKDKVSEAFETQDREFWLKALDDRTIPGGPMLERDDWLDHPQVIANDLRVEVDDPERGKVVMPGVAFALRGTPGEVRGPAPMLGQHNGDQPWDKQERQPEGQAPLSAGPLSHIKVFNMGTFVATPYAGSLLSELGADVIKVEALDGDPFRGSAFAVNRGMRSLAVDLKSEEGRKLFKKIVAADIDVVINGMRPGVMKGLGIDHDDLAAIKPDIITSSLAGFGMKGDLASKTCVDMVVQAMSGMMMSQGGNQSPVADTIAINDVTTAAMTALATVLALYHRERTGEGQSAWDSLMGTSTFLMAGELTRFEGREPARLGAPDFKGHEPLDRYYEVADGRWIRVQAIDADAISTSDLKKAGIEVSEISVDAIAKAVAGKDAQELVDGLNGAGIPAVEARHVSQLYRDPALRAAEFSHVRRTDDGFLMGTPGRMATFSRTQRQGPLTAPGIGEHTEDILREHGMSDDEIQAEKDKKAVVRGPRMPVIIPAAYR